jgi:hypothetical protein
VILLALMRMLSVHGYANTNAKAALWIQQGISVNDLPPVIDLDPMAGIQYIGAGRSI